MICWGDRTGYEGDETPSIVALYVPVGVPPPAGWESIESYERDMMIEEANSYAQHVLDESMQAFSDSINWDTPGFSTGDPVKDVHDVIEHVLHPHELLLILMGNGFWWLCSRLKLSLRYTTREL